MQHIRPLASLFLLCATSLFGQGGCDAPTAGFTSSAGDTARICLGIAIIFDGSASAPAPGGTIVGWIWNDGENVDTTNVPSIEITFPEPGYYPMSLHVVDALGCVSEQPASLPVFVAPPAQLDDLLVPGLACAGVDIPLSIAPTQPTFSAAAGVTWTEGAPHYLPDDVGALQSFPSQWILQDSTATINSVEDLGNICLDIEHSSSADLFIDLICPNGQNVSLVIGGSGPGTFLGDAIDSYAPDSIALAGTCFTYCFNADPDFGMWVEHTVNSADPNVMPVSMGQALIPGSYETSEPLSQLIGCPMNGTWTLTITDLWGADNGYLCSWHMGGGDNAVVVGGPVLGSAHPDSSMWSGANVVADASDPTAATGSSSQDQEAFTYTVQDSYGCWYDTTVVVEMIPSFSVDAGPDTTICSGYVQLFGSVSPPLSAGMHFHWTPAAGITNAGSLTPSAWPTQDTYYVLEAYVEGPAGCSATDTVFVAASFHPVLELAYDSASNTLCLPDAGFGAYDWDPYFGSANFTTQCINPPPGLNGWGWSVTATDAQGCLAYSDTVWHCNPAVFTLMGNELWTNINHQYYIWTLNGTVIAETTINHIPLQGPGVYGVTITTVWGCSLAGTYPYLVTGVGETPMPIMDLLVRPIPNDGRFEVMIGEAFGPDARLRVLDLSGRVVEERSTRTAGSTAFAVDLDVVPGTYIVEVNGGSSSAREVIIIAR